MKHPVALGLMMAAALPLSGCALFKGKSAQLETREATVLAQAGEAGSYFIQLGRRELDAGRTGLALEAFNRALDSGEDAAAALNGIGVVYARLGRYEVAHRMFAEAAERDPGNAKYAANLARLTASPAFALRRENDMAAEMIRLSQLSGPDASRAEASFAMVALPEEPRAAAVSPLRSSLERVAPGEFRIHSAMAQPAPVRTALSTVSARFRPLASVEFARSGKDKAIADADATDISLNTRPRVVDVTGFKPAVRVNLAPTAKVVRPAGKQAGSGN
jgi:Flp pilus assembly protein TadD